MLLIIFFFTLIMPLCGKQYGFCIRVQKSEKRLSEIFTVFFSNKLIGKLESPKRWLTSFYVLTAMNMRADPIISNV